MSGTSSNTLKVQMRHTNCSHTHTHSNHSSSGRRQVNPSITRRSDRLPEIHKGVTIRSASRPVFNIRFIQQRSSGLQAGGLSFGGLMQEGREGGECEQRCFIPVRGPAERSPLLAGCWCPVQAHSDRSGSRRRGRRRWWWWWWCLGQGRSWAPAGSL